MQEKSFEQYSKWIEESFSGIRMKDVKIIKEMDPEVLAYKATLGLRSAMDEQNLKSIHFPEPYTNTCCNIGKLVMTGREKDLTDEKTAETRFRVGAHLIGVLAESRIIDLNRGALVKDRYGIAKWKVSRRDKWMINSKDEEFLEDLICEVGLSDKFDGDKLYSEVSYDKPTPYTEFFHPVAGRLVHNVNQSAVRHFTPEKMPLVFKAINKHMENPYLIDQELLGIYEQCKGDKVFTLEHKLLSKTQKKSIRGEINETIRKAKKVGDRTFYEHLFYDNRGRMYSSSVWLNHGGNKLSKSLYRLQRQEPIGASGLFWMFVHAANVWGEDKLSLDDGHNFAVKKWEEQWKEIANNPVQNKLWQEADSPFEFLSAILELKRAHDHKGGKENYPSGLMVAWDATCSGLQVLSALSRDEVAGAECNLTNTDRLGDYYMMIAKHISVDFDYDTQEEKVFNHIDKDLNDFEDRIQRALEKKNKKLVKEIVAERSEYQRTHKSNIYAASKVFWSKIMEKNPKLLRKVCKRPCMTYFYSCKEGTMSRQMFKDLSPDKDFKGITSSYTFWICKRIEKACRELMSKPTILMDLFIKMGIDDYYKGIDFEINAPYNNFLYVQTYRQDKTKQIKIKYRGKDIRPVVTIGKAVKIDYKKTKSASSPNIVHMLDSQIVSKILNEADYDVSCIHDSFSASPANAGKLYEDIRRVFVEIFEEDVLLKLLEQKGSEHYLTEGFKNGRGKEVKIEYGTLDLNDVYDNGFCFK